MNNEYLIYGILIYLIGFCIMGMVFFWMKHKNHHIMRGVHNGIILLAAIIWPYSLLDITIVAIVNIRHLRRLEKREFSE